MILQMAMDFQTLRFYPISIIAAATYYGFTIRLWFSLKGCLMPHIYKWLCQDGVYNIIPSTISKKFNLPTIVRASALNPVKQN
jgi:hypothetical protein